MTITREITEPDDEREDPESNGPGLLLVAIGSTPSSRVLRVSKQSRIVGRSDLDGLGIDDDRMSRTHAEIGYDGARFRVADLASRNGTFLDGVRVRGEVFATHPRTLRLGRTLFSFVREVAPYRAGGVARVDDTIVGPRLRAAWARIERAARASDSLVLSGESGVGKELAARLFHRSCAGERGPFIAVNCAAIPESIAERLLFGARKGAYSGATADAEGFVQAAHGGTLFLDEVAELGLAVQAKLLRVLESREVTPLGAARARPVDLRIVCATHKDLRRQVIAHAFREDLYFRLGRAEVTIPPLRERPEEIPFHVADAVDAVARRGGPLTVHASLVEACLSRHWPGNVRELVAEVERAALEAASAGRDVVEARDLAEHAGCELAREDAPASGPKTLIGTDAAAIEQAIERAGGNVTQAARDLGIHRNQLRRWVARNRGNRASSPETQPATPAPDAPAGAPDPAARRP